MALTKPEKKETFYELVDYLSFLIVTFYGLLMFGVT